MEYALGLMVKDMKVNGWTIKNMVKEYIFGLMEENMRVIIEAIKNMEWEHILGLMVENILDNGKMISVMVEENM
jgi:hypothetical protein